MDTFRKQFTNIFDLSPELTLDQPLIMMVGKQMISIENHKGITLYTEAEIRVRVKAGLLVLTGSQLLINNITSDNLSISGQIEGIFYNGDRRAGD